MHDREVVAKIAAGDPTGIAEAYDGYAAALYGYCHWMLSQPADAAEALTDVFVMANAALGGLPEDSMLRPWLYAVAHKECQRRLRSGHAKNTDEADRQTESANKDTNTDHQASAAPDEAAPAHQAIDATMPFRAILQPPGATDSPIDATMSFRAIRHPTGATDLPIDATMPFRAILQSIGATDPPIDATQPFRAIYQPIGATDLSIDATQPFRAIYQPIAVKNEPDQTDLPAQVRAILSEFKPREREIIELSFRHGLDDTDLAIALGVSWNKAHALASRARNRLEERFTALLIALTGREECPELDTLLTEWDGQFTEKARDLVGGHIETCEKCAGHKTGPLRTATISKVLPLAEPPPGLREHVLTMCSSTTPNAVAYRRRTIRRAESLWSARLLPTISLIWRTSRGEPRVTAATVAMAAWVVVVWVVLMTVLILTNPHSSRALAAPPSASIGSSSRSPAAPATSADPPSASFSPSPSVSTSPTYVPPSHIRPALSTTSTEPSRSPKPSSSPKPSKSASPSPSPSESPSPSPSPSVSPSPSLSAASTS